MMYLSFNKSRYKEIILRQQSSCTGRWPMTFYVSLGSSSFGFSKHRNLATAVLPCQTCSTAKVDGTFDVSSTSKDTFAATHPRVMSRTFLTSIIQIASRC